MAKLLSRLLEKYPSIYYDQDNDTLCVDVNEEPQPIEEDAKWLIEDYFNGEQVDDHTLTGEDYVKHLGGVVDAFKEVGVETW